MSIKRKRDQDESEAHLVQAEAATTTQHNGATQDSEDKSGKTKGRSRQERSERRSKKLKKSKENRSHATAEVDTVPVDNKAAPPLEVEATAPDQNQSALDSELSQNLSTKTKKPQKAASDEKKSAQAPTRFIVFVGNLPFNATASQVRDHFSKLAPSSVRLSTDKATGKSKGFAFLEFDAYDKMKTCLKLYHHSLFDPEGKANVGKSGEKAAGGKTKGRKINVELTAGGGGKKSQERMSKIKGKNDKLNEERKRRSTKDKSEQKKAAAQGKKPPVTGANAAEATEAVQDDRGAIHPSRLSRVGH
ncbi:hypothetical protein A1O3_07531 [Capronia epimyces CBS 606.96]|uniref:RRM domain-containing protein n=1 Tax=Capronia epimyces CBS 606.96 TaxID=1182542 RepID=W9XW67_9EURO|nr:uncharacterized protein A1O3_07531 [Capronia epimyces CBS 606.96]EXJ81241.1 hypothetical protein A1O3_07531 [Capronia epimyces CBS 606.96]